MRVTDYALAVAAWVLAEEYIPEKKMRASYVWETASPAFEAHVLPNLAAIAAGVCGVALLSQFVSGSFKRSIPKVKVDLSPGKLDGPRVGPDLRDASHPGSIVCYNPATMELLGYEPITTPDQVKAVVDTARMLQKSWAATSFAERRRVLRCIHAAILAHQDDIVRLSCIDTGKPRVDAQFGEILSSLGKLQWVIDKGEEVLAPESRTTDFSTMHKVARVEYAPLGVIGVIAPWNYPFYNLYNHIASGLFAGNAVVLKISEYSAWSGARFIRLARECLSACGYNPDLVQLIQGFGDTGAALVSTADKIIFTGSPGVGKMVMRGASSTLTPLVLELGGKDPFIVCEDADVDSALSLAMRGTFQNAGQNCVGIERIYVYEGVYDAFVAKAEAAIKGLRVGPAVDSATGAYREVDVGCITTQPQLELIQRLVDDAVAKGAKLHAGGKILYKAAAGKAAATSGSNSRARSKGRSGADASPTAGDATEDSTSAGLFYAPTLLSGVDHTMDIANNEVFGPVMTIFKVAGNSDAAAIAMANSTEYGLGATVYSGSPARANAIAAQLHCGMVGINSFGLNYLVQDLPFGGVRASGFDRFAGPEGLRACCLLKSVVTDFSSHFSIPTPVPKPLQYPVADYAPVFTTNLIGLQFAPSLWGKVKALFGLATAGMSGGKKVQ